MAAEDTERALVADIIAAPHEDAPRLVYADLLEARGDPRGEFVHIQCALARATTLATRQALEQREQELLRAHGGTWLSPLGDLKLGRFTFRRGFVEVLSGYFSDVIRQGTALAHHAPLLSELALTVDGQTDRSELARPVNTQAIERVRELSVRGKRWNTRDGHGPIADLRGLARVQFTQLRTLSLASLGASELTALLASPALNLLEALTLRLNVEADALEQALAATNTRPQRLDLSDNVVSPGVMQVLVRRGLLEEVRELRLEATHLSLPALSVLDRVTLPKLTHLALGRNLLGDLGAEWLSRWAGVPALQMLTLERTGIAEQAREHVTTARPTVAITF